MRALYYDGSGLAAREIPRPIPGPGEALIKVAAAGVCRTDLEILKGYMVFSGVPGHEFVGKVVEGAREWVGRRVAGEINLPCGRCRYCAEGLGRHCPARTVLGIAGKDGAFAEYITLPAANLHAVPDGMADETAVFTEPVAAAFEIVEQVAVAGKTVAVLGDGKLGIIAARVLAASGARVALAGRHEDKLARARSAAIETMMLDEFLARTARPEARFEVVVEATGRPDGFGCALSAVRPRGVIVQKTTVAGAVAVDLSRVVVDEVTVVGSRCGPFPPALAALASGAVRVDDLVEGVFSFADAEAAVKAAAAPGALKVLMRMSV